MNRKWHWLFGAAGVGLLVVAFYVNSLAASIAVVASAFGDFADFLRKRPS